MYYICVRTIKASHSGVSLVILLITLTHNSTHCDRGPFVKSRAQIAFFYVLCLQCYYDFHPCPSFQVIDVLPSCLHFPDYPNISYLGLVVPSRLVYLVLALPPTLTEIFYLKFKIYIILLHNKFPFIF